MNVALTPLLLSFALQVTALLSTMQDAFNSYSLTRVSISFREVYCISMTYKYLWATGERLL